METPEGLTPGPDGSFYGEYQHVPMGWLYASYAKAPGVVKDALSWPPDAVVQCWPPKPRWTTQGHAAFVPGGALIHCYRPDRPGEDALPKPDPELAERVARLLNEDDQ